MTLKKLRINCKEEGFTLIELMIVIAIIGILAAIAIPNYISFRDKGYCSGAESDVNSILGTLADYYAIPAHTGGINGTVPATGGAVGGVTFKALTNGNTGTIASGLAAGAVTMTVTVTDTSTRCPSDYRQAQSDAGWTNAAAGGTFSKTL